MSVQNLATLEMVRRLNERIDKAFQKGTIIFRNDNIEPAEIYGGVWNKIEGRFLISAGGGLLLGEEGGENEHTLTDAEIPHYEGIAVFHGWDQGTVIQSIGGIFSGETEVKNKYRDAPSVDFQGTQSYKSIYLNFGGGQPHNNMPPYKAVNIWEKIAD